jgi:hypothetical protein
MKRPEDYTRSSFRPLAKLRIATVITGGHRMTLTLQRGRALVDTGNKLTVFELQRRNCPLSTVNKRANDHDNWSQRNVGAAYRFGKR